MMPAYKISQVLFFLVVIFSLSLESDLLGDFPKDARRHTQFDTPQQGPETLNEYVIKRNNLLKEEEKYMLGSNLTLNSREMQVNNILMKYKKREYNEGVDVTNGRNFAAAHHFFHSREQIQVSNVYKIIQMMPKGGALHMHDTTTGSVEYVALNLTYWPNLYLCFIPAFDNHLAMRFFDRQPEKGCVPEDSTSKWIPVQTFRDQASSSGYVDQLFVKAMTLFRQTPELDYRDNNGAWYYFGQTIDTVGGVVSYEKALRAYYYQTLQEFYDDNVMYIENRGLLEYVYRLDQSELTPDENLKLYQEVTDEFVAKNPDFWGAKFIITPIRVYSNAKMREMVNASIRLKNSFPSFFAGFDIVSHEDVGYPNYYYIQQLLLAAENGIKFFFHAGESDWHGTKVDDNILDAILLNTTRIGHGTALNARPYLMQLAVERGIGIEISPISGQVLKLASEDSRVHPMTPFLRNGYPIVIHSDNPGMWGATGLSYDWYYAFMGMAGQRADLRFLKQLAINSILYSAMSNPEKRIAMRRWQGQYNAFLDKVIARYSINP